VRHQLEVNVVGQLAVTQALLPRLRGSRGRVVFISSVSGRVATPFTGVYNASKFALEGLADALRMELRPWGVRVVLIEPGPIDTDIWRTAHEQAEETAAAMAAEHRELYADQIAGMRKSMAQVQRQTILPDRVAEAVELALTTAKPKARYVVAANARAQLALRAALPTNALDAALVRMTSGSAKG
jgi:NAD(P)-dependent dehydrogenase (short-subunit alcohol dehydrogenase family)